MEKKKYDRVARTHTHTRSLVLRQPICEDIITSLCFASLNQMTKEDKKRQQQQQLIFQFDCNAIYASF